MTVANRKMHRGGERTGPSRHSREEQFRRVKELTTEGLSVQWIARRLPVRATAVDPFAAFVAEWVEAGNRNSADPCRELKGKGIPAGTTPRGGI